MFKIDLKEISINTKNGINSVRNRNLESHCECGIEPPGSIIHRVRGHCGMYKFLPGILVYPVQPSFQILCLRDKPGE